MKKLLLGVILVLVLVVGGLVGFRNTLAAMAIQHYGSQVLGTRVEVGAVELGLTDGRSTIRSLRIANPEGFSAEDALAFDELTVRVDPSSVMGSPLIVSEIRLAGPRVRFEATPAGRTNMDQLRRNADVYAPRDASASEAGPEDAEPRLVRIDALELAEGSITTDLPGAKDGPREVKLPSFRLTDLGGVDGAPAEELAKQIAGALTGQVARAAMRGRATQAVRDALRGRPEGQAIEDVLESLELPGSD